jgi:sugar lactone lactonase YvrE
MQWTQIADFACRTGEGPLWHPDERRLYWLDIPAGRIFRYTPALSRCERFDCDRPVGGMTLQEDGALLLFMGEGRVASWRDGELGEIVIDALEEERGNRFNDVIADPEGRVFCGVMSTDERAGRLYRLDADGSIRVVKEGTGTANGMGFTPDMGGFYFTDTRKETIVRYDYDRASGELSNERLFATTSGGSEGRPDGMTVDIQGGVWSARWGGRHCVHYSPEGEETMRIHLPACNVSCVAFGGPDYRDLYITTAGGDDKASKGWGAGALYVARPPVHGVPEFRSCVGL